MKKKLLASFVLIVLFCGFITKSFAEQLNDLYNRQNEIQEQKNNATTKLGIVKESLSELLQQINGLNENIMDYQGQVQSLDNDIVKLQDSITNLEEKLDRTQKEYDKKKKVIDNRLIALYQSGETNYLDVLLNAKTLSDFLSNYYMISLLTEYDARFLREIETKKNSLIKNKEQLEKNKKEIREKKEEKETTSIILKNTITMKNSYMAQLSEEERKIQEDIDNYQTQLNEIESEIMQITLANLDSEYIGGIMAWPVPGYTVITSPYGMRTHPVTGIYKLHTGTDIRAPIGANFIAANAGIISKVSEGGAYGKMVMVDHGGGISTLYAHGSEILVQVGQTVKQGEPILKVGNTGYSTGAHAHFEVRVNGVPVDPIPYITNTEEKNNN